VGAKGQVWGNWWGGGARAFGWRGPRACKPRTGAACIARVQARVTQRTASIHWSKHTLDGCVIRMALLEELGQRAGRSVRHLPYMSISRPLLRQCRALLLAPLRTTFTPLSCLWQLQSMRPGGRFSRLLSAVHPFPS